MILGFFDRIFSSKAWKIITILLFGFLIFSFAELLLVADRAIQLSVESASRHSGESEISIKDAYFNGIIAISVFLFLAATWINKNIKEISQAHRYRALGQVMRRFARGHSAARYRGSQNDEVGQLGKTFNFMADSLQRLIGELQRYERQRQEMVVSIAHDLAGPLTAISGYLKTLNQALSTNLDSEKQRYFDIIKSNLITVTKLVNELSDLAKLDVEDFPIQKDLFSLKVLASDVVSRFLVEAERKSIALTIAPLDSNCLIKADLHLIERAISNIIENAIRYTEDGGNVSVSLEEAKSKCKIIVSDSGIGIPKEDLPFVFNRFFRVDKARSRSSGGSGLGLSITKRIIELHNGSISIDSEFGKGTEITISLDLEPGLIA